ncbi:GGDEF domain-containing protein [Desulfosarcina ovata]|uniref:GGDEF domain-containing protein n=1 Tax=Desulfosarcina ovata TaxID=83564 RepID=UPI0012D339CE|nr:GGDEF domain-containing protein [Desulfosarcina ovata]
MPITTIRQIESVYRSQTDSSFRDSLTGLFTYGFFLAYVEQEFQRLKRYGHSFSLAVVDLDAFGQFNHQHGAIHGDKALKKVGQIIQKNIRTADISSRYAGDQFALFFVNTTPDNAITAAEKLIWLNTCQEKNLSIPKKLGPIIFIERLDRGGVCNNDGRAL